MRSGPVGAGVPTKSSQTAIDRILEGEDGAVRTDMGLQGRDAGPAGLTGAAVARPERVVG